MGHTPIWATRPKRQPENSERLRANHEPVVKTFSANSSNINSNDQKITFHVESLLEFTGLNIPLVGKSNRKLTIEFRTQKHFNGFEYSIGRKKQQEIDNRFHNSKTFHCQYVIEDDILEMKRSRGLFKNRISSIIETNLGFFLIQTSRNSLRVRKWSFRCATGAWTWGRLRSTRGPMKAIIRFGNPVARECMMSPIRHLLGWKTIRPQWEPSGGVCAYAHCSSNRNS